MKRNAAGVSNIGADPLLKLNRGLGRNRAVVNSSEHVALGL